MIQSVVTNSDSYTKKCGEIFVFSKDNLSLVCDYCRTVHYTLEAFGIHLLHDHLPPQLSTNIKCEDSSSCDSYYNVPNQSVERFLETDPTPTDNNQIKQSPPQQSSSLQNEPDEMKSHDFLSVILKEEHDEIDFIEPNIPVPKTPDFSNAAAKENIHQCSFCIKTFETKQKCNDHENLHTGIRPYLCRLCPKTFHSLNSHRYHIKLHSIERPHNCLVCEKGFIRKNELDKHIREKHLPDTDPRRYFPCKQCDKTFKTYKYLRIHINTLHIDATGFFSCDYCQQSFMHRMLIVRHMLKHAPKRVLKCSICDKRFFSKKLHDDHLNVHTGNRYQCQLCSKAYLYRASLRRHMTKTHLKPDVAVQSTSAHDKIANTQKTKRPHKCKVCLKTLASSNSLKNHIKLHTNERHKCLVCDKTFIKLHRLNIHTRENHLPDTDPKRYFSCGRCDKKYENYSQLRYHTINSHTNLSGTYTCDHCQTKLYTRRSLLQHMLKHSSKNGFECKVCGKIFLTWYQRDDHENIHSGKRPYQCEFCPKAYTYKPNLTRHLKSHEDENDQLKPEIKPKLKPLPPLTSEIKQERD